MTSYEAMMTMINEILNKIFTISFGGITYIFAFAWFILIMVFIRSFKK